MYICILGLAISDIGTLSSLLDHAIKIKYLSDQPLPWVSPEAVEQTGLNEGASEPYEEISSLSLFPEQTRAGTTGVRIRKGCLTQAHVLRYWDAKEVCLTRASKPRWQRVLRLPCLALGWLVRYRKCHSKHTSDCSKSWEGRRGKFCRS